jgi:hypothetical protein
MPASTRFAADSLRSDAVAKRLLKLIRAFLNAGVMENGLVSPSVEPRGSPLSRSTSNKRVEGRNKWRVNRGWYRVKSLSGLERIENMNTQIRDAGGIACHQCHAVDFGGCRQKAVDNW